MLFRSMGTPGGLEVNFPAGLTGGVGDGYDVTLTDTQGLFTGGSAIHVAESATDVHFPQINAPQVPSGTSDTLTFTLTEANHQAAHTPVQMTLTRTMALEVPPLNLKQR